MNEYQPLGTSRLHRMRINFRAAPDWPSVSVPPSEIGGLHPSTEE
ncbi:hypothetical protein OG427_28045 [Streptomyces sp. NBC_00133]